MYKIHLLATRSIDETFPIPLLPRVTTSRQVSRLPYAPPPTHGLTQVIVEFAVVGDARERELSAQSVMKRRWYTNLIVFSILYVINMLSS